MVKNGICLQGVSKQLFFSLKKPIQKANLCFFKIILTSSYNICKSQQPLSFILPSHFNSTTLFFFQNYLTPFLEFIKKDMSDMSSASSKDFLDIQANYRVQIHSETCAQHDNNIQSISSLPYCSPLCCCYHFQQIFVCKEHAIMRDKICHFF